MKNNLDQFNQLNATTTKATIKLAECVLEGADNTLSLLAKQSKKGTVKAPEESINLLGDLTNNYVDSCQKMLTISLENANDLANATKDLFEKNPITAEAMNLSKAFTEKATAASTASSK